MLNGTCILDLFYYLQKILIPEHLQKDIMHFPYFLRAFNQKWHALSFLSKEIIKVNDHVLQVVLIMFLGTYSTILGRFGGIKSLNKEN
jgi:hypothetical protein